MTRTVSKSTATAGATTGYQRVDIEQLPRVVSDTRIDAARPAILDDAIRWSIIPLSAGLCVVQAAATIVGDSIRSVTLTGTQIPVLAFVLVMLIVLGLNPLLRVAGAFLGAWARPLNRQELICLFTALMVTCGISGSGLIDPLIPLMAAPQNPEWNTPASGWNESIVPRLNPSLYIQDRQAIAAYRKGVTLFDGHGHALTARNRTTWFSQAAYGWKVLLAIPWMAWIVPLAYWSIFILGCYGIFYSLSYLVLDYWTDREKLIFPLARLYESVMPEAGACRDQIPRLLRAPGFWTGFAISFLILTWNADVVDGWLKNKGLAPISLGMGAAGTSGALAGSIFQGLAPSIWGVFQMLIIFTALGIAFLLPLEVSFSVWFYYLVGRGIMLLHIWSGLGENILAFPSDGIWQSNATTSLGGGGLFLFSGLCLFRCVRDYWRMTIGHSWRRRAVIALPVVGLAGCMAVVALWLRWNRLPLGWAIVIVASLTLLAIGLMRIVAESGIYTFQMNTGFFHLYKMLGLGKFLAPALLAPLAPIYSTLFYDCNTSIAPNLLHAAEMRKRSRTNRLKFQVNLLLALIATLGVSFFTSIYLGNLMGANSYGNWFYLYVPQQTLGNAQRTMSTLPAFDLTNTLWFAGGILWVALSIFLRTIFFWFPHPIGFILLASPGSATSIWFSFFVGWICKKLVVRYGGKATFDRVRRIFIGLIAGELAAIVFWSMISLFTGISITSVSLNRWLFLTIGLTRILRWGILSAHARPELSIILPTCNRAALLQQALDVVERTVACRYELVVVDGASDDGTADVLAAAARTMGSRLRVIREERRQGAVKAMNLGCRAAMGEYLTVMNDDARPLAGSYDNALEQIRHAPPRVGLLALFHRMNVVRNIAYETYHQGIPFRVMHVRATLYANFPLGKREVFDRLGYFDERFVVCGSDPDFSLKVWHAGLSVAPAFGALIDHDEHQDQRRQEDDRQREKDNQALFAKWDLPERNPKVNDFDPTRPCTLRGLRTTG